MKEIAVNHAGEQGPNFLCIGAQKAGTTWLYDQLVHHPQVWLPVIKELHYFNFAKPHPDLAGVEEYPLGTPLQRFRFIQDRPSLETLLWLFKYNYGEKGQAWYRSLFPKNKKFITGEMTPAYSTLNESGVRFVHDTVPSYCRVIFILRHPVDRIWSAVKMNYRWGGKDVRARSIKELRKDLLTPTTVLRSRYSVIIPFWQKYFGERFECFNYEDLQVNPKNFLKLILDFLQIERTQNSVFKKIHERSNADNELIKIPENIRKILSEELQEDIAFYNKCKSD